MNNHHHNLVVFIVARLPDSLADRITILDSLLHILPARHPDAGHVLSLHTLLQRHVEKQQEFTFPSVHDGP